jgi:hypothetical protein
MKHKNRKARLCLLAGMFLIGIMPMKSGNLYISGTNGSKHAFSMNGVTEITFSGTAMVVAEKSGGKTSIPFADLQTFSLRPLVAPSTGSLYVYGTDASKQTYPLWELQDLTYSETAMSINKKTGGITSVLYDNLKCFSLLGNLYINTGISLPFAKAALNVFPNPAVDEITLKNTLDIIGVSLYDMQGHRLLQLYPESQEVTIPFSSYPAGIYTLQVIDKNGVSIKKIIKN